MTDSRFIQDHAEFYEWWMRHRHSGFIRDSQGRSHWNMTPSEAYSCTRYRVEFSSDTGSPFETADVCGLPIIYTASELEGWAQEQRECDEAGGNAPISKAEFQREIGAALKALFEKFAERTQDAKSKPKHLLPGEINRQVAKVEQKAA